MPRKQTWPFGDDLIIMGTLIVVNNRLESESALKFLLK